MTYHILDHNDFKRLAIKKCIFICNTNYSYNNKIVINKFLKKYQIKSNHIIAPMGKDVVDKYGGEDILLCDINYSETIEGFRFYIYDTKEFWEEELKGNKFKEIEL